MFYAMQCVTRGSDYGSLSTLGSSLLKLDLIEPGTGPDTKLEVLGQLFEIFQVCVLNPDTIITMHCNAVQVTRLQPLQQTADGLPDLQEDDDSAEEADTDAGQGDDDTIVASNEG